MEYASLARWALRTALIAAGPWLASYGFIGTATLAEGADLIVGGVMTTAGIVWSWFKHRQRKAAGA